MSLIPMFESAIKAEKKRLSKLYKRHHKHFLRFLDILMVMAFLCNMGALALTEALVVKENPPEEIVEVNIVGAKIHGYKAAPLEIAIGVMLMFFKQVMLWSVLLFGYIYFRRSIWNDGGLYIVVAMSLYIFIATSLDFAGNLGYFIGLL